MLLLSLDFETTGLNTKESRILEVGASLYSTNHDRTLMTHGFFIDAWDQPIPKEVKCNRITKSMIDHFSLSTKNGMDVLLNMIDMAEGYVGHNIYDYDYQMLIEWATREGVKLPENRVIIDTMYDLPGIRSAKLKEIAADCGFINMMPHSALADVMTVLRILYIAPILNKFTLDDILARAKSPRCTLIAQVDFDHNQLAKDAGYRWDKPRKIWQKAIKEIDLDKEVKDVPFDVEKVPYIPGFRGLL